MKRSDILALAERLDNITLEDLVRLMSFARQIARAQPAAWRVECRWTDRSKGGDWCKYADYGTEQAALSSRQVFANPGDVESRIVPLFPLPLED